MWSRLIKWAISITALLHMATYVYCSDKLGGSNPNGRLQRGSIYMVVFLLCQLNILKERKLFFYLVASGSLCLVLNEVIGSNCDLGWYEFVGFIMCFIIIFVENKLLKRNEK